MSGSTKIWSCDVDQSIKSTIKFTNKSLDLCILRIVFLMDTKIHGLTKLETHGNLDKHYA